MEVVERLPLLVEEAAAAQQLKNPKKAAVASQAPPPKNRIPALHQKQVPDQKNLRRRNPAEDHPRNLPHPNPRAEASPAGRKQRKSEFRKN
jgi:hypothetical protein